ncbi:hypothetical protein [Stenotrophomonas bentonitica]|uniref:hypothetical protein n=1 Tax=Stenotrophomonas bentonitica TaxID=1450134 RepID=UPI00345E46A5
MEIEVIDAAGESLEESVTAPLADWATLSQFEVRVLGKPKVTARVYANGLQQVPVEIVIQALDKNGVVVQLSMEQLKGIKLIDYVTEADIKGANHARDTRFVYHWDLTQGDVPAGAGARREHGKMSGGAQVIFLHVSKDAVTSHKVAAQITSPSGVVFRTNTANPTPGKFDSWVIIQGVERIRYDHTNLEMDRVDEASNSYGDVDLYYIRFKEQGLNIVHSVNIDVPSDEPHVHEKYGPMYRVHYAYSVGSIKTYRMIFNGVTVLTWQTNKRPGQATVARVTLNGFRLDTSNHRREACMRYHNQHGNYVECALGNSYTDDFNLVHLESNVHS